MTQRGNSEIELNGANLQNGIYLYKVFVGKEIIGAGKMVLLR